MTVRTFRERPKWLDEEILIQSLLNSCLDKLDRNVKPHIRINQKTTPQLYDFAHGETEYLWGLITALANEYHIFSIKRSRSSAGKELYDNAKLLFNIELEPLVRHWLNRPIFDPYLLLWQKSLEKYADKFEHGFNDLLEQPIYCDGKTAQEVVEGLVRVSTQIKQPYTLRALSARCFWGDSKFLDKREILLKTLFPSSVDNIIARPILIAVYIPEGFQDVVFIENQDSFLMLVNHAQQKNTLYKTALIYSGGFRGTAGRVRTAGYAVFSYMSHVSQSEMQRFNHWWFLGKSEEVPCAFWGDLDYSGMAILAALRKIFENMQAWKPGYDAMIQYHEAGVCHTLESTHKENQKDPKRTFCSYADTVLLPLMRTTGRFVDQEIVELYQLYEICTTKSS